MRRGPFIFLGVFFALALSWYGMIVVPQLQFGRSLQVAAGLVGVRYPVSRAGLAQQGSEVYRANGCYYCHTQQVRPEGTGADVKRGWGMRFSVAQDYLLEQPVMLGELRVGPDLANMGIRLPLTFARTTDGTTGNAPSTNEIPAISEWHLKHLYNPRITSPKSNMPRYPYLFSETKRRKDAPRPENALNLPPEFAPNASSTAQREYFIDVVPKHEAIALVEYLLSLRAELPLFEAPLPAVARDVPADRGTNQPAAEPGAPNQPAGTEGGTAPRKQ